MSKRHVQRNGFSLIAIGLILVVLGALVIINLMPSTADKFEKVSTTQNRLDAIRLAITAHAAKNSGTYPCPARFDATPATATGHFFGRSVSSTCAACGTIPGETFFCTPGSTWIGAVPVRDRQPRS